MASPNPHGVKTDNPFAIGPAAKSATVHIHLLKNLLHRFNELKTRSVLD